MGRWIGYFPVVGSRGLLAVLWTVPIILPKLFSMLDCPHNKRLMVFNESIVKELDLRSSNRTPEDRHRHAKISKFRTTWKKFPSFPYPTYLHQSSPFLAPPEDTPQTMPLPKPRQSRVSAPRPTSNSSARSKPSTSSSSSSYQKANRKRKSRGLNAFHIAAAENPERSKVNRVRLGEVEDEPVSKRKRVEENEGDDEGGDERGRREVRKERRDADEDIDSGSDSEGGRWRVGVGEEGEDSDVDSEEAFGSGDEEAFEGFRFGGDDNPASRPAKKRKIGGKEKVFSLNEDEEVVGTGDEDVEEEDDGFGDEGVDLADVLDDDGESEDEDVSETTQRKTKAEPITGNEDEDGEMDNDEAPSEYSDEDAEGKYDMSDAEEVDEDDPTRQEQVRELVQSRSAPEEPAEDTSAPPDRNAMLARAIAGLQKSSSMDPTLSREAQRLSRSMQPSAKDSKKSTLVSAPLPKRQQDRIDRAAARKETNKTLDRWVDTVKHNRRAEHLTFPLPDPHAQDAQGTTSLTKTEPQNDLERTIANIMKECGLGHAGGKAAEKQLEGFEELQTNKMPLEEVQARRAELRKQRELMFREEIKAKRIKKIKSKAYRRVHRKDAQKAAEKERDLLAAAGIEEGEDEREANDRRRAEERMGAKHREGRWAKSVKSTGRAAWDEGARDGVNEMARRGEELRRRQQGERQEDGMESDVESSDDEDEIDGDEDEASRLQRQLGRVDEGANGETSRIGQLAFMQRADAARRQRNDEDAERVRKDLAGEESGSDSDASIPETSLGRKAFGPSQDKHEPAPKSQPQRAEFEEGIPSDDEADELPAIAEDEQDPGPQAGSEHRSTAPHPPQKLHSGQAKPFMARSAPASKKSNEHTEDAKSSEAATPPPRTKAPNTNGWTTVNLTNGDSEHKDDNADDEQAESDPEPNTEAIEPSNWDLVQSAFGGNDVEKDFEAEKASAASSEDEKFEDNALPGWGSWTGTGVSKRAQKRADQKNKGRFVSKTAEGVKPDNRKDAKLDRVIVSEKRQRKNAKYLANQLPHPFESKTQYERGLRQPVGPEWTTKQTFQDATKPRVLTKPGRAIKPMEVPML